jgi:uncharacterized membrane protein YhaH (DUF805 family)
MGAAVMGNYLSFSGRINRKIYWINYGLVLIAVAIAAEILDRILFGTRILSGLVSLLSIIPSLAAGVKRCHDRDRSGWFLLIGLIPVIGAIWLFVELGCLRGTEGTNRFGPDPLYGTPGGSRPAYGAI